MARGLEMGDTYKSQIYKHTYPVAFQKSKKSEETEFLALEEAELSVSEEVTLNLQEVELVLSALGCSVDTLYAYHVRPPEKLRVLEAKFRAVREKIYDEYLLEIKK